MEITSSEPGQHADDRHSHAPWKRGVRVLGVAESFVKGDRYSNTVGVVMRGDLMIDGLGYCRPTVGGTDVTSQLLSMFSALGREDIRVWVLGGSVVSWFNIVDLHELSRVSGVPVVCVSYYASEGILEYLKEYFPDDWEARWDTVRRNGERQAVRLNNGHEVFVNTVGISTRRAKSLLDMFTVHGRVPEPVRVARVAAAALRRDLGDWFR